MKTIFSVKEISHLWQVYLQRAEFDKLFRKNERNKKVETNMQSRFSSKKNVAHSDIFSWIPMMWRYRLNKCLSQVQQTKVRMNFNNR